MNQLAKESSPYLLQHANNPVEWYPWGAEALEKAKRENKLIVLSIGYSACHWCHVMEHESFEDEEVAEVMNTLYVNIKVDREERPDIDQIYMSALQLMNGRGGWPLNCILLPDQRPIYGGTYFKKSDWINILSNVAALHRNKPEELLNYADKLIEGVRNMELISTKPERSTVNEETVNELFNTWWKFLDIDNGGMQGAPKFPVPSNISFLLNYEHHFSKDTLTYYLRNTLHRISSGGIYDQLAGGIYRYSVDAEWKIPHFEKMLYDQAQCISLYSEAYQKYKDASYLELLNNTISFCVRELKSPSFSAFFSALDADSEGVEGKFYCWTVEEIQTILGKDADAYIEYYQFTKDGNFEHGLNNLIRVSDAGNFLLKHSISEQEWNVKLKELNTRLLTERNKRVRPGLDDKILCSWNALLIKGFCDAYKSTSLDAYKTLAIESCDFIRTKMISNGNLYRNFKDEKLSIPAFLDDYAFLIQALISVYEISGDSKYLMEAEQWVSKCIEEFYDSTSCMFWYTSNKSEELVARKQEYFDSVIPSSNSVMQFNLMKLGSVLENSTFEDMAIEMLHAVNPLTKRYPPSFSNWLKFSLMHIHGNSEIIVIGEDSEDLAKALFNYYLPSSMILFSKKESDLPLFKNRYVEGKTLIYVCKNKSCQLPVSTVEEALLLLE